MLLQRSKIVAGDNDDDNVDGQNAHNINNTHGMSKNRNYRKKTAASLDDDDDDNQAEDVASKLDEAKEEQKLRKRPVGVT